MFRTKLPAIAVALSLYLLGEAKAQGPLCHDNVSTNICGSYFRAHSCGGALVGGVSIDKRAGEECIEDVNGTPMEGVCTAIDDSPEFEEPEGTYRICCFCQGDFASQFPCSAGHSKVGTACGGSQVLTNDSLMYDFQGVGEFLLVTDNDSFAAQVRKEKFANQPVSVNTAVAMTASRGDEMRRVAFYLHETPHLRIDGVPVTASFVDLGETEVFYETGSAREPDRARVVSSDAKTPSLNITFHPTWMDVEVEWPRAHCGMRWTGLLGYGDGYVAHELRMPSGQFIKPATNLSWQQLYGDYGESLRVHQTEPNPPVFDPFLSLFDYADDQTADSFTDRNFPPRTFHATDLKPRQRARAAEVCRDAGVTDPTLLDACTLDVAVFGTPVAAKVFVRMPPPEAVAQAVGGPKPDEFQPVELVWPAAGRGCTLVDSSEAGWWGLAGIVILLGAVRRHRCRE